MLLRVILKKVTQLCPYQYVSPRMHPVRRDACVMTHEAEMVDHDY